MKKGGIFKNNNRDWDQRRKGGRGRVSKKKTGVVFLRLIGRGAAAAVQAVTMQAHCSLIHPLKQKKT